MRTEQIGDATLYLGDCLEILPTLGKVDAVVTDPPYGVGLSARVTKHTVRIASKSYRDDDAWFAAEILPRINAILDAFPRAVVTTGRRHAYAYPPPADMGCGYFSNGAGRSPWGFGCFTPILFYGKDPYLSNGLGSRPNSFSATHWFSEDIDHPCPKPVKWMEWMVNRASLAGETVCDPFMGSGTTGVACAKLGRKFIGIEIEEKYFDIACKRIEDAYKQPDLFIDPPAKPKQEVMEV